MGEEAQSRPSGQKYLRVPAANRNTACTELYSSVSVFSGAFFWPFFPLALSFFSGGFFFSFSPSLLPCELSWGLLGARGLLFQGELGAAAFAEGAHGHPPQYNALRAAPGTGAPGHRGGRPLTRPARALPVKGRPMIWPRSQSLSAFCAPTRSRDCVLFGRAAAGPARRRLCRKVDVCEPAGDLARRRGKLPWRGLLALHESLRFERETHLPGPDFAANVLPDREPGGKGGLGGDDPAASHDCAASSPGNPNATLFALAAWTTRNWQDKFGVIHGSVLQFDALLHSPRPRPVKMERRRRKNASKHFRSRQDHGAQRIFIDECDSRALAGTTGSSDCLASLTTTLLLLLSSVCDNAAPSASQLSPT